MSHETLRSVDLVRVGLGHYQATNSRGDTLQFGSGGDQFTPVELLLAAIAGCSAADVDHITVKRSEPSRFQLRMTADKVRDDSGNHLDNLSLTFDVDFPDGDAGDAARAALPRAVGQSHDRLCTVSRTVELGVPVGVRLNGDPVRGSDYADLTGETERMLLRPYRADDYEQFADLHGRDDVSRYLPWQTRDAAASRAALERHLDRRLRRDGDAITFAAIDKDTGGLVGELVLFLRSVEHRSGEVGYILHPDFQGRGFATEGARAMLKLGFETMGMRRIIARLAAANTASAAVLTRLGMRKEAHLVQNEMFKGEWADEADYAMLSEEWANRPTSSDISWNTVAPASTSDPAGESPPPKP